MDSQPADLPGAVGLRFTDCMRRLCAQMVRHDQLAHIQLERVAIRCCKTRAPGPFGMHASLTPLRFAGGASRMRRHGRWWELERLVDADAREMLYLLSFYLPRFLDQPLRAKLETVVHELWHIGPRFDGDLRRYAGRCYAHSSSQKKFEQQVARLTTSWLASGPPPECYAFLNGTFAELVRRHGPIVLERIRSPRMHAID